MADEDDGSGVGGEVVLEPLDGNDVEVVGGLVEEEEVGTTEEQFGKFDAHLPSAAEDCDGAVEVGMFESEAQQDLLGGFAAAVATEEGEVFGDLVVAFEEACVFGALVVGAFGDFGGEAFLLTLEVVELAEGGECFLDDGADGIGHHLLWEVADGLAGGADDSAAFGFLPSAKDFEECGLAGAVHADEADAVVVGDVEGDVVEEVGASELDRKVVDANHNGI